MAQFKVFPPYEHHDGKSGWNVQELDKDGEGLGMMAEFSNKKDAQIFANAKNYAGKKPSPAMQRVLNAVRTLRWTYDGEGDGILVAYSRLHNEDGESLQYWIHPHTDGLFEIGGDTWLVPDTCPTFCFLLTQALAFCQELELAAIKACPSQMPKKPLTKKLAHLFKRFPLKK